jgi:AraC family transcriptional activator FtrA
VKIVTTSNGPPNLLVAALVYDQLCSFEFGCAVEVFGLPRPEFGERWYQFVACAAEPGPLRAVGGVRVMADAGLDVLARAGTIIVPGWKGADSPPSADLCDALRQAHAAGARLVTICSGVFLLAAAGVLTNEKVTTHWRYAEKLKSMYPRLDVDPNVLYVDAGRILTSAGSAAGLDLCLHLVRRDFGAAVAAQAARMSVVALEREGGQAQFMVHPSPPVDGGSLAPLLEWLDQNLRRDLSLAAIARRAAMSTRTLSRRFREQTGMTPAQWVILVRVRRAQQLLETTWHAVDRVAGLVGFASAATLRVQFQKIVGTSPQAYRRSFRGARG